MYRWERGNYKYYYILCYIMAGSSQTCTGSMDCSTAGRVKGALLLETRLKQYTVCRIFRPLYTKAYRHASLRRTLSFSC